MVEMQCPPVQIGRWEGRCGEVRGGSWGSGEKGKEKERVGKEEDSTAQAHKGGGVVRGSWGGGVCVRGWEKKRRAWVVDAFGEEKVGSSRGRYAQIVYTSCKVQNAQSFPPGRGPASVA